MGPKNKFIHEISHLVDFSISYAIIISKDRSTNTTDLNVHVPGIADGTHRANWHAPHQLVSGTPFVF